MKGNCYGDFQQAKNNKIGDFSRDDAQMGWSVGELWDKGVTAVENLASKELVKYITPSTPVPSSTIVTQPTVVKGQDTTTTQYIGQPMTDFQQKALLYGGIAVGSLVFLGLVKTIFPSR